MCEAVSQKVKQTFQKGDFSPFFVDNQLFNLSVSVFLIRLASNPAFMRAIPCFVLWLMSCLLTSATIAQQNPFSPIKGFSVFTKNDATIGAATFQGALAVGGNLNCTNSSPLVVDGSNSSFQLGGLNTALVVDKKINFEASASNKNIYVTKAINVKVGDCSNVTVWYTNPYFSPELRITPSGIDYLSVPRLQMMMPPGVSATNNPVCEDVLDFEAAFDSLQANSLAMAACTTNVVLRNSSNNQVISPADAAGKNVIVELNPGINVLNIQGSVLSAVQNLYFSPNSSVTHMVVLNVDNPGAYTIPTIINGPLYKYGIINFHNATDLTFNTGTIVGSVFAPSAKLTLGSNTNVVGQVAVKELVVSSNTVFYDEPFSGEVNLCVTAPTASFTVNNDTLCYIGNGFTFTNTTTGNTPVSYQWSFGDGTLSSLQSPVKSYSSAGDYVVTLIATNAGGSDTSTTTVTVLESPNAAFSANDTTQDLTGNAFTFTPLQGQANFLYEWSFGDGSSSSVMVPSKTYGAIGAYMVYLDAATSMGCTNKDSLEVIVTSDGISGGNNGGLESRSLGDKVSKRNYQRVKNGYVATIDYSKFPDWEENVYLKTTGQELYDMVPKALEPGDQVKVTSPNDLLNLTTAKEVLSIDFVRNNKAKAVVLGIKTYGKAYNHTKAACDRFKGAKLIGLRSINLAGYHFTRFELLQPNKTIEYVVSFVAGKKAGRPHYALQTNWAVSSFHQDDTLYAFQVWAKQPDYVYKLVADIVWNLTANRPLVQSDNADMPNVYVAYGERVKENLVLQIFAKQAGTATLVFDERVNEKANYGTREELLTLNAGINTVSLAIRDGYEYEGRMLIGNKIEDEFYMADGNWGLDYVEANTDINQNNPINNNSRVYQDDEYPVYRGLSLKATTNDYIIAYKSIRGGAEPVDLSAFKSLNFYSEGKGTVTIYLIKQGISNFKHQYKMVMNLPNGGKEYAVSLEDFYSDAYAETIDPSDVTHIMFSFSAKGGRTEDLYLFVNNIAFSKKEVVAFRKLQSKKLTVAPNPVTATFECRFDSDSERTLQLQIVDLSGRVVHSQRVDAKVGSNVIAVNTGNKYGSGSVFLLTMRGNDVKYETERIIIK